MRIYIVHVQKGMVFYDIEVTAESRWNAANLAILALQKNGVFINDSNIIDITEV
jgi:hypothetical protein